MSLSLKDAIFSKYGVLRSSVESAKSDTSPSGDIPKPIQKALSGIASGSITTAFLHPFEVLKIRMQSDATLTHKQTWRELYQQVRTVGIYNGAGANIIASGLAWGVYFGLFETFKPYTHAYICDKKTQVLADFTASLSASTISQFITNPLWVLKTRMSLQNVNIPGSTTSTTAVTPGVCARSSAYRNVFHGLYRLAKEEGIRGYYKVSIYRKHREEAESRFSSHLIHHEHISCRSSYSIPLCLFLSRASLPHCWVCCTAPSS